MKLNYNKFLANGKRSDIHGYNIYTRGLTAKNNNPIRLQTPVNKWDPPSMGLNGAVAIGHEIDKSDLCVPVYFANGENLSFEVVRNTWTPAYMTTVYRCTPYGEYKRSGLICVKETKAFSEDDVFVARVTVTNDGRNEVQLKVTLSLPFERISEGLYSVKAKIMPGSLFKELYLDGVCSAKFNSGEEILLNIPAQSSVTFSYGFSYDSKDTDKATKKLKSAFEIPDIALDAEKRFNSWIDNHAPYFECDDLDMMKVYYYRLFLIKCAVHTPEDVIPDSEFKGPCVYESPFGKWFGAPVGLPIPLQLEELKWLGLHNVTSSHIDNWAKSHGCTQSYIQFTPYAILKCYYHSGDETLISNTYNNCKAFTLQDIKDVFTLPQTRGSWVTGAEYQPSFYQHTNPQWDWRHDNEGTDDGFEKAVLYRLDECVMFALNLKALGKMAEILGNIDDNKLFDEYYKQCCELIKNRFWDEEKNFFFDIDVKSGKRCNEAPCYDGFMPMLLELDGDFSRTFDRLINDEFVGDYSLRSVSTKCPMYWFDNCITGPVASSLNEPHSYHCCWNGPVWPFAVSLVLDSLGNAMGDNVQMKNLFCRIFEKYTELHFESGDRSIPCIFEHYRPTDGMSFSKFNEYFHSEWINLLFSHFAGIHVTDSLVTFSPATEYEFQISGIEIRGEKYTFRQYREGDNLKTVIIHE